MLKKINKDFAGSLDGIEHCKEVGIELSSVCEKGGGFVCYSNHGVEHEYIAACLAAIPPHLNGIFIRNIGIRGGGPLAKAAVIGLGGQADLSAKDFDSCVGGAYTGYELCLKYEGLSGGHFGGSGIIDMYLLYQKQADDSFSLCVSEAEEKQVSAEKEYDRCKAQGPSSGIF